MRWSKSSPREGDVVRVRVNNIWHYGIYVCDAEIIQFGANPAHPERPAECDITVMAGNIEDFLLGKDLEVADYDKAELDKKRSAAEIVSLARARIGERGYDIIHNNCEHFVNECAFGEHRCEQVDIVRELFRGIAAPEVYVAAIPGDMEISTVYPTERNLEIQGCKNDRVKLEKYAVWKLLEYAANKAFGLSLEKMSLQKSENGKWESDKLFFSLSHSDGIVAVAVAKHPIGVDVESLASIRNDALKNRIFSDEERASYDTLDEDQKKIFILDSWTKKESEFKRIGGKSFVPNKLTAENTKTFHFNLDGKTYSVSVAGEKLNRLRFFGIDKNTL